MSAAHEETGLRMLRVPPQSVEAEQAVLGAVMLADWAWPIVADLLQVEDFYRRDHQLIFRAIEELAERKRPFDAVTLGEWFEAQGLLEQVAGGAYLVELASTTPSAANVRAYAEIVRDKAKLRQLITAGTTIVNNGYDPQGRDTNELIAEAHGTLVNLANEKTGGGPKSIKDVGLEWYDDLHFRYANKGLVTGIVTPWSTLNKLIVNFEPGHLVILAGRPSMGKSACAVNLATSCALREDPKAVLYFDLESTGRAIYNRAVASVSGVPLRWLREPDGDNEEYWGRVTAGIRTLRDAKLRIDDTPGLPIQRIIARARLAYQRDPFKVLMIDHLHLIPLPGKTRETVEIGHITAALKQLAKELNITVILLSQLNRSLESRSDRRPTMADLRESGNIEQDADVIVFLYRDDYYAERENRPSKSPGLLELIVAKQREGEVGTAYAKTDLAYSLLDDVTAEEVQRILSAGKAAADDFEPPSKQRRTIGSGARKPAQAEAAKQEPVPA